MITVIPALHLLVAISMAAPSVAPSACAAEDLHCSARAFRAAARHAKSDEERVEYLYFASRAYLALSERPPHSPASSRDLCQAKQLIDQAVALPATELRGRVTRSRQETRRRLKTENIRCQQPKSRAKDDPPRNALAGPQAKLEGPTQRLPETPAPLETAAVPAGDPETATPPPSKLQLLADVADAPIVPFDGLMPVTPSHRRSVPPRPGRGLVITSGVSLGVGIALGVSAGLIDGRMTDTRLAIYGLSASIGDNYGTQVQNMTDDSLRAELRTQTRQRAGLAIGAGATVVVAIVLAAVGGRKLARAASRAAILPAPGGLVFRGQF